MRTNMSVVRMWSRRQPCSLLLLLRRLLLIGKQLILRRGKNQLMLSLKECCHSVSVLDKLIPHIKCKVWKIWVSIRSKSKIRLKSLRKCQSTIWECSGNQQLAAVSTEVPSSIKDSYRSQGRGRASLITPSKMRVMLKTLIRPRLIRNTSNTNSQGKVKWTPSTQGPRHSSPTASLWPMRS
jgi:hypothetical protein